ncbi:hypothetical protein JCM19037_3069 [Geomicrobium sp. JCM 19037]|uniref:YlmH family RNA-binding protein n=1 Tax=unclassified Geomicrobium TaxID=2628951 RepID=UPI00045F1A21|nr:YlmH/Sll1252 family protein [Geomicrobium sp. JCM 19037]GAK04629.1 hypothetical protein JCM19037_3069 [Geomicrobium sp. JCM 19037]
MDIFQHYRQEEHGFIELVQDWKETVGTVYEAKLSGFLDPRECDIVRDVIGADDNVKVAFFGGVDEAERQRALVYPFFESPERSRFHITVFQASFDPKFTSLSHPDLLGALMGLGVKREMYGDLHVFDTFVQWFVTGEMEDFVRTHFNQAGNTSIVPKVVSLDEAVPMREVWEERSGFVSSLRLDTVIAELFKLSRSKAKALVERERVKVNWKVVDQPAFVLREGDTLSVRQYGRRKLLSLGSTTKKGNVRIHYGEQK